MQQQREIDNNTVFVSATEPILFDGCDRRLFGAAVFLCILAGIYLFAALEFPYKIYAVGVVLFVFLAARWGLRELAIADPLGLDVYRRHIKWPAGLPAQGKMLYHRRPMKLLRRSRTNGA